MLSAGLNNKKLIIKNENMKNNEINEKPALSKMAVSGSYIVIDEIPKEGDYGINPEAPDAKPRLIERFSNENDTLGFRLEPTSWFSWLPLRDYHRKVVFE